MRRAEEVFVDFREGHFVDLVAPVSTCAITEYFAAQGITLCDGQHAEAGLEACDGSPKLGAGWHTDTC